MTKEMHCLVGAHWKEPASTCVTCHLLNSAPPRCDTRSDDQKWPYSCLRFSMPRTECLNLEAHSRHLPNEYPLGTTPTVEMDVQGPTVLWLLFLFLQQFKQKALDLLVWGQFSSWINLRSSHMASKSITFSTLFLSQYRELHLTCSLPQVPERVLLLLLLCWNSVLGIPAGQCCLLAFKGVAFVSWEQVHLFLGGHTVVLVVSWLNWRSSHSPQSEWGCLPRWV